MLVIAAMKEIFENNLLFGFLLSLFAGLSTGLGAAIAFFLKKPSTRFLTFAIGTSAGVMLYISFMELIPSAQEYIGEGQGKWIFLLALFGGMALAGLVDRLVPDEENPHEIHGLKEWKKSPAPADAGMKRSAYFFALSIAIHNFPEGMATMASAFDSIEVASSVALAVAIHNIPEGVAVAIPLYFATKSRKKSFFYATLTGLAEPIGALVAMLILLPFLTPMLLGILFASVSGIMIYISLDELLPMSRRWGHHHLAIYGVTGGMLLMGLLL